MSKRTLIILSILIGLCNLPVAARHTLEVGAKAGISSLLYQSDYGKSSLRVNTGLDIAYAYISPHYVGYRIGLSADYSASAFVATDYEDQYTCTDVEFDNMEVHYTTQRWQETHHQLYLSVPIQFAVAYKRFEFYIGPKLMLPVYTKYDNRMENADLQCTYTAYQSTVSQALALTAGNRALQAQEGDILRFPKIWYALSAEIGYSIPLAPKHALRLSLYADVALNAYSLTSVQNLSAILLTDTRYGIPVERTIESALNANRALDHGKQVITSMRYFDFGLKVTWLFRFKKSSKYNKHCNCLPDEW